LVDVYGVGTPGSNLWKDYARTFATSQEREDRLWVISSYTRSLEPLELEDGREIPIEVRPKSPEMLYELRSKIEENPPAPTRARHSNCPLHMLITGAGFEIAEAREHGCATGMPPTPRLLFESGARQTTDPESAFPVPVEFGDLDELKQAASAGDLDAYWEVRLREIKRRRSQAAEPRAELRYEIAQGELNERDKFRSALLGYDVGHLAQALWAGQLDWAFWLSTNYTHFADRALHFLDRFTDTAPLAPWQRITTRMETELVHSSFVLGKTAPTAKRWLLKLHGDIGQTQSMALAASDKEPLSTLAVRPQLDRMYELAAEMILRRLEADGSRSVCHWHVVGHGLRDNPLLDLLFRVQSRSAALDAPGDRRRHVVTVVAKDASVIVDRLRIDRKLDLDKRFTNMRFVGLNSSALRYMRHLRELGLPGDPHAYDRLTALVSATATT
jgi:hypothetical protein